MMRKEHLSYKEIIEYINTEEASKENEDKLYIMDLHLSECEECMEKVHFLRELHLAADSWTAELQGKLYREAVESKGNNLETKHRERIKAWVEQYLGKADAAAEIRVDEREELLGEETFTTKIITGGMNKLLKTNPRYMFSSALPSVSRGRAVNYVGYGTEAVDEKSGSVISVDTSKEDSNIIRVELADIASSNKAPLVILMEVSEKEQLIIKEAVQKDEKCSVEFEGVSSGRYLLLIEPV